MTIHQNDPWWHIFSDHHKKTEETCPAVPVHTGQNWQKGLAAFYCPCKSDPKADECQFPLI